MKQMRVLSMLLMLTLGCSESTQLVGPDLLQEYDSEVAAGASVRGSVARPFMLSHGTFQADWAIDRNHELACGGGAIAGGASTGKGSFTHLGRSTLTVSIAWNVGNLIDPAAAQFVPVGPAGGPIAPVLGPADYPYAFHFNPFTGQCEAAVRATGEVEITAANGDKVFGMVTGGETYRLDFVNPGDGAETFAIAEFTGGTGRFQNAAGAFITHTITRFDYPTGRFVIDLVEVLPGGTIAY